MELDSIAVHRLLANYGLLIDQRRTAEWSELFVSDGRLEIVGRAPVRGRSALSAFAEDSPEGTHLTGVPALDVRAGVVLASSTWMFFDRVRRVLRTGFYHDEIAPPSEPGGAMLFAHRKIEMLPDLSGAA